MMTKNNKMFSNFMGTDENSWYNLAPQYGQQANIMQAVGGYSGGASTGGGYTGGGYTGGGYTGGGETPQTVGSGSTQVTPTRVVATPTLVDCSTCSGGSPMSQMFPNSCPAGWVPTRGDAPPCQGGVVYGCTDVNANNFNNTATHDNGSCTYTSLVVYGCTQSGADNFNTNATTDDGSCTFAQIYGCMDANAGNYNENATIDDGQCTYDTKYGCTDNRADNYDATATNDDGTCAFTLNPPAGNTYTGGVSGGGGGFPSPYGVGMGEVFPPIDSGIGGMPPSMKTDEDKNLLEKYWWLLVVAGVGYYLYTQKNKTKK